MNLRSFLKGTLLMTVSAALIALVTVVGFLAFIYYNSSGGRDWGVPIQQVSDALDRDGTEYRFKGEELLGNRLLGHAAGPAGAGGLVFPQTAGGAGTIHSCRCGRLYPMVSSGLPGAVLGAGRTGCWWWAPPRAASGSTISLWTSGPCCKRLFGLEASFCWRWGVCWGCPIGQHGTGSGRPSRRGTPPVPSGSTASPTTSAPLYRW